MATTETSTLADKLRGSATLIDSGREAEAEPALDLHVAAERAGLEILKVTGAMDRRIVDGDSLVVDRQHVARLRRAYEGLQRALFTYESRCRVLAAEPGKWPHTDGVDA